MRLFSLRIHVKVPPLEVWAGNIFSSFSVHFPFIGSYGPIYNQAGTERSSINIIIDFTKGLSVLLENQ